PWSPRLDYDTSTLHNFPSGTSLRAPSGWNLRNNEPYLHMANFFRRTAERNRHEDWRVISEVVTQRVPATRRFLRDALGDSAPPAETSDYRKRAASYALRRGRLTALRPARG